LDNEDTYLSVTEALKAAAWSEDVGLDVRWIDAESANQADFADVDALLVPGGFGSRGVEGKIAAVNYALDHKIPFLAICQGCLGAVTAAASRAGLKDAKSGEFDSDTKHNVVYLMNGQEGKEATGGTLRLGDYPAELTRGSVVAKTYGETDVVERHRHRYE